MADSSSRRSFLFGRQASAHDDWSKFVVTLKRTCRGAVRLVAEREAHLQPATLDDVIEARKLCQAHSVVMALDGLPLPEADCDRFVLWVEAGSAWGSLIPLGDTGLWRVDAGCPVAVMQAAGLVQDRIDSAVDPRIRNLAHWFAMGYRYQPLIGTDFVSRLVSVDWLLPDGTIEVFGAFGAHDSQPLGSLAAQRLVPKLFELSVTKQVHEALELGLWRSRFHLDALADDRHVNLAHFFVGHMGSLGWLVAATFRKTEPAASGSPSFAAAGDELAEIDVQTKRAVDPGGVFLSLADQTG